MLAFKPVVARLVNDTADGAAALAEIDDESLGESILRFNLQTLDSTGRQALSFCFCASTLTDKFV